ncbi:EAL domain-containing protein [Reinekea marina]|uniref:EAL domain-containing protein n=1 Tax=Reinekea marina TaxID=1310421 RepID=A0ABV7WQM2_9GAMM|nr:GGDEF domain-containing phosphodiesterase [Reinekea marina]MDN3650396.1 EAL domain-containing protein [Reinekea marina]
MTSSSSGAIRVLLIHDTQNEAEPLANAIRNSGQAVRSHFIASLDELNSVLESQTWDLLLAKLNTGTVDTSAAVDAIVRDGKDLPMIGLISQYDEDIIASALDMGMADVIIESSEQHLTQAIKREFSALRDRRLLRTTRVSLKETEKRVQLLLESSVDAISYVHEGMHIHANPAYLEMFGYDDLEELQCTPIMDLVAGKEINTLKDGLKQVASKNEHSFSTVGKHAEGEEFKIQMTFSSASYEGESCTQIVIRRIEADSEVLQEKIKEISSQDLVTGLHNKLYFNEQLDSAYQKVISDSKRYLIAHIGIANFADIKVKAGVAGTDVILKQIAQILSDSHPKDAQIARYADDMFGLLSEKSDLAAVKAEITSMLKTANENLYDVDGKTIPVTLAAGLAHIDEQCDSGNKALVQADQAYNSAIKSGEPVCYFDRSDIANLAENSIVAKVQHALEHDGLRIQFQPIMSLRGDSQEHYDVLVRLKDKDGSDITPDEFIDAIENSDMSSKLDRWVVEKSLENLASHRARGHNTQCLIHLTPASIQDPAFLPWVNSILKKQKLPGDSVCFQVREEAALSYLKAAKAFSKGMSLLKCQLAINRFGLAENSKQLMNHLDISYARVHPSFVEELTEKGQASDELQAVLTEIHSNDINSIVPQIEQAEVLASLWELGVNYIQGYYLQAPLDEMAYNFDDEDEEAV